jgi:uncharacterized protein (TIGR02246 family)
MDEKKPGNEPGRAPAASAPGEVQPNASVDEFFSKLQQDILRWPKPSEEAVAAARLAMGRVAQQSLTRDTGPGHDHDHDHDDFTMDTTPSRSCAVCGVPAPASSAFCGACGAPMDKGLQPEGAGGASSRHHYHHHYHHHYFEGKGELGAALLGATAPARSEAGRPANPAPGLPPTLSRAEAAVRTLAQDLVTACNTRHLENVLDCYAPDALVLRTNIPPIRGTASIREFYFAALDAGLSDVELEAIRTVVAGDMAFEVGRCKMLAPIAVGKRREERGKYVLVFSRRPSGEWKILTDSWNSDLALKPGGEMVPTTSPAPNPQVAKMPRRP